MIMQTDTLDLDRQVRVGKVWRESTAVITTAVWKLRSRGLGNVKICTTES